MRCTSLLDGKPPETTKKGPPMHEPIVDEIEAGD
jgi:hypothetical protein